MLKGLLKPALVAAGVYLFMKKVVEPRLPGAK